MQSETGHHGALTPELLSASDPSPVEVINAGGASSYVLTCEHAGRVVPQVLGDMGLDERHRGRHIAWDIGVEGLSRRMAAALDAPLVLQRFSRLVIDCNRPLAAHDTIPEISDGTEIPANKGLGDLDRSARICAIHKPYHDAITAVLDQRRSANKPTSLISMHSFTPCLEAAPAARPWDVGLLYNRHEALAHHVHDVLEVEADHLSFAFNEPYQVKDHEDYTIPIHGEKRGLPNMLFEVRNDHIAGEAGQRDWASMLSRVLSSVASRL